jgi:UDP-MurNAc hydroxylase
MKATSLGHAGILIETGSRTIVCDPWFVPAFWASWFVFPRNDQLPSDVMEKLERPDYLYISHQHGDHLDEAWLTNHIDKSTPVLLPDFATRELERQLNRLGFTNFIRTRNGVLR